MPTSLDDYEVMYKIGSGSYGTCKKIRRKKDGKVLVWKEIDYGCMTESEKQMLVSEVNLLRELKHENIVRYYDRIIDRTNTTIFIIMEYCEGGDLSSLITRCKREGRFLEEDFVWKILCQVLSALDVCHRRKSGRAVLHRDLKPANVFLDSKQDVKLGDFGLARVLSHDYSFAKTFVGTPYYMSPEQMNHMSYNEKSDIWSLGCMLYELCALHPPFTASNQKELASKIRTGRFIRIPARYSTELNSLIAGMLILEGSKRPSIEALLLDPAVKRKLPAPPSGSLEKPPGERVERRPSSSDLLATEALLKMKEESFKIKQKEYERTLREIEAREKSLELREKLVDDKLARAERLMRDYNQKRIKSWERSDSPVGLSPDFPDYQILPSCLTRVQRPLDSPKKQVHFQPGDKENNRYAANQHKDTADSYHRNAGHYAKERDPIKERLYRAKLRSLELRNAEIEAKVRTRQLLGMR